MSGTLGVATPWNLGHQKIMNPRCPGYRGVATPVVLDTRQSFFFCLDFFQLQAIATDFKAATYHKIVKIYNLLYKYI